MPGEKRKRTSIVWEYFTPSEDGKEASCKLCARTLKTTGGSTSGLGRHLSTNHDLMVTAQTKRVAGEGAAFAQPDDVISRLAAVDGVPFSQMTTTKYFGKVLECATKSQLPHSSNAVREAVLRCYAEKKSTVITEMKKMKTTQTRYCLSLDEWTSGANKRYLSVNAHFRGGFWNLGLAKISGSFTSQACLDLLKVKLAEFKINLETDVFGLVTDGAAVMTSFANRSGRKHQLCLAHGIHLAVADVMYKPSYLTQAPEEENENEDDNDASEDEEFDEPFRDDAQEIEYVPDVNTIICTVRSVVKKFRKSPQKMEVLQSYSTDAANLLPDTKTRWNSMVVMLQRFLSLKEAIQHSMIQLGEPLTLSEQDFDTISDIVNVLEPVKLAVEALCRRDADLVSADAVLAFMIQKLSDSASRLGQDLCEAMKFRIRQRRSMLSEVADYLHYGSDRSPGSHPGEFFSKPSETQIIANVKLLYEQFGQSGAENPTEESDEENTEASESLLLEISLEAQLQIAINQARNFKVTDTATRQSRKLSLTSKIQQEMSLFMKTGKRGKIIGTVYDFLMCIPPSSVESERVFSSANNFCRKTRSRLGDKALNALVFLKSYFQTNKN